VEEAARKERVATLIGDKTRVTIPDLHRVPRRPIRNLQQPSAEAIDQFGHPVPRDPENGDATKDSKPHVATPLTNSGNMRRISKPTEQASSIDSGFSVTTNGTATTVAPRDEEAPTMTDPFDANYFNRRFATPASR